MKPQKPKIIAWTKGLTVIPFESIHAVDESHSSTGAICVFIDRKQILIPKADASQFIEQYNHYLAFVEESTISMVIPEDGGPR